MSLPLSLEILSTDRSLGDNEGAVRVSGSGWVTKNVSCSELGDELGDEYESCSEHRGSQLLGVDGSICASGSPPVHSEL